MSIPRKTAKLADGSYLVLDGGHYGSAGTSYVANKRAQRVTVTLSWVAPYPQGVLAYAQLNEFDRMVALDARTTVLFSVDGGSHYVQRDFIKDSRRVMREHGLYGQFARIKKEFSDTTLNRSN